MVFIEISSLISVIGEIDAAYSKKKPENIKNISPIIHLLQTTYFI